MKDAGKNLAGNQMFTFAGKLLSLGTTELLNSNKKVYKIANIEFTDVNGEIQKASAAIYAKNLEHGVEIGKEYLTTATIAPDKDGKLTPYLQMSHLEANAGRAEISMFLTSVEVATVTPVGELKS